jgi:tetratricopeptide (TPR) repeat protein
MDVRELTLKLAENPIDVENNFNLAIAYEEQLQYASAAGFYLRAAEYGYKTHPLITYTSLLKMALCWGAQGDRNRTIYNNIMQAITYLPNRPEAYFLLCRIKERNKEYQECYTYAELGLLFATTTYNQPLPGYVEYNGSYCLLFEKAVAGWWIGRRDESKTLFQHLLDNYEMSQEYVNGCLNNMSLFN